jgi:4-hydroxy-tetrahydrodipicolinate synthase
MSLAKVSSMPPFNPARLRTVHLVPLTAFDERDELNLAVQADHTAALYAAGVRVFLPAAGTGEFHSLSADEIVQVIRVTREAAGADALVFAPVGGPIGHALDVARRSVQAGADGLMFMPLGHPYLSDAGALDYYSSVLDRLADVHCLIYKSAAIPSDSLLSTLARRPQVVGVKYAVNDLAAVRKLIASSDADCEWLCGSAERFAPYFLLAGCGGYTSGAGNVCPRLTLRMHAAFAAGDADAGFRVQKQILPIEEYRARAGDSYGISMLKQAMSLLDRPFGLPRPPQRKLTAEEQSEIQKIVAATLDAEVQIVCPQ